MENRWSERTPIQLDLIIFYGPIGLVRAQTRDISSNGMFLNTGLISLAPEEQIEITLNYSTAFDKISCQMMAEVVYCDNDGAGVAFVDSPVKELDYVINASSAKTASC